MKDREPSARRPERAGALDEPAGAPLEAGDRALAEAVEQQAATSKILRLISGSPADVGPVFDAIVAHAARLCEGYFAFVMLLEDG